MLRYLSTSGISPNSPGGWRRPEAVRPPFKPGASSEVSKGGAASGQADCGFQDDKKFLTDRLQAPPERGFTFFTGGAPAERTSQRGKTVAMTGTEGLGFDAAQALASTGAYFMRSVRNPAKGN